jgi:hypothetical protein
VWTPKIPWLTAFTWKQQVELSIWMRFVVQIHYTSPLHDPPLHDSTTRSDREIPWYSVPVAAQGYRLWTVLALFRQADDLIHSNLQVLHIRASVSARFTLAARVLVGFRASKAGPGPVFRQAAKSGPRHWRPIFMTVSPTINYLVQHYGRMEKGL